MKTHISIIVPVKNSVGTIRDLLESLMKLDYDKGKLEIIIVDGLSNDGTRNIIKQYPVTLLYEEGRGLNAARNTGIKYSKGDIVAFTDADCIVPENWIRSIEKNFIETSIGFVGGVVEGYNKNNFLSVYNDETFFKVKPRFRFRKETTEIELFQFPAGCNMAFKRQVLEKVNFFDERFNCGFDDLVLVEELVKYGFRIVLDPDVKVWHQHPESIKEIIIQHFNYGRGGASLMIYKKGNKITRWFTTYLFSTTFAIIVLLSTIALSLLINNLLPIKIILGIFIGGLIIIQGFYIKITIKTKNIMKIIVYPILDLLRGFCLTIGGIFQLLKFKIIEDHTNILTRDH